jgi:hypothetical protein
MDKRLDKIHQEVQKTMESLDHFQRLEGNPYLYTRVKQKMASPAQTASGHLLGWLQPIALMLLLLVNGWAAYSVFNNTLSEQDALDTIAAEYPIYDTDFSNYYTLD